VRLDRLEISNFRNIERVRLDLVADKTLLIGDNAQGKSNLLEAIYLLAAMKSPRAETDAQLIRRAVLDDPVPVARIAGHVVTAEGPVQVEVTVLARPGVAGPLASKRVKINGVPRRASDAVGRMTAVLFTAEDLDMVAGPPAARRRYLDMTLAQVDPRYSPARSRFDRLLTQRNSLLRRIRDGLARSDELEYWDGELASEGAILFRSRAAAMSRISELAAGAHSRLAPQEHLVLAYRPRLDDAAHDLPAAPEDETRRQYQRELSATLNRDVAAGITLTGPHRDDVDFVLDGLGASFASRAQQRTMALSLRLAEAEFLGERRGEPPVLLLDDVLSEMDSGRRQSVLAALGAVDQMIVSGADLDRFPPSFHQGADVFTVDAGSVRALVPGPRAAKT
jgi:DNA replication and repair protein RecF